ncbi:MAG: hypothetical protein RL107_175 [Actinomycetota bacterium]|jgi:uncharacterized protein YndB with AHSA1/START domain
MSEFLYSVEREFAVPIDEMWHAWTDAASLEEWYCPTVLSVLPGSVVSEPTVGGWWAVAVDVPDNGFVAFFYGQYSEVVEQVRLAHTLYYTQDADEFAARDLSLPHHIIHLDFEPRGENSWVRFTQFGELPEGEAELAQAGIESYFDNLEIFLSN